jgi:hypothetical protein
MKQAGLLISFFNGAGKKFSYKRRERCANKQRIWPKETSATRSSYPVQDKKNSCCCCQLLPSSLPQNGPQHECREDAAPLLGKHSSSGIVPSDVGCIRKTYSPDIGRIRKTYHKSIPVRPLCFLWSDWEQSVYSVIQQLGRRRKIGKNIIPRPTKSWSEPFLPSASRVTGYG